MASMKTFALWLAVASALVSAEDNYVGSKACFGCHPAIYKSFQKTDMGRSMSLASEWKPESLPTAATVAQPGASHTYAVSHDEAGWKQTETEPGVFSLDHQLEYVVGTGYNGLTFLIRRGSYLFQAPLSYYSKTQKWDLSPGYEKTDLGFNRKVPEECINCHAGRPATLKNIPGAYANTPFQELAVGCENCHGPGGTHVKSAGKGAGSIVNPAKLGVRLADNICLNCHQSGGARVTQPGRSYLDFRPGQWLFDTAIIFKQPSGADDRQTDLLEHFSAMQASRCFRESTGKLSCLTCHDPHVQPRAEEASSYYRPKCLSCHSDQSCRIPLASRQPKDDCIGCHMPKRDIAEISHSALTNHRIPARDNEPLAPARQDMRDGLVIVDPPAVGVPTVSKLILLRAYQQMAQKNPDYQSRYLSVLDGLEKVLPNDPFVQAALGDRAFTEERTDDAISHLKLALPIANPGIYLELGQSLAKLGRHEEAIEYLKKGTETDPYNAVLQKTLILEYINLKSYPEARQLMQQYVADFPEDSLMRSLLARVSK